jgi:DNA-directed RNA polymerase specialized sigma24 family protein
LPPDAQEVLFFALEMDCSMGEIAIAIGSPSVGAARMKVDRARKALQRELRARGFEGRRDAHPQA